MIFWQNNHYSGQAAAAGLDSRCGSSQWRNDTKERSNHICSIMWLPRLFFCSKPADSSRIPWNSPVHIWFVNKNSLLMQNLKYLNDSPLLFLHDDEVISWYNKVFRWNSGTGCPTQIRSGIFRNKQNPWKSWFFFLFPKYGMEYSTTASTAIFCNGDKETFRPAFTADHRGFSRESDLSEKVFLPRCKVRSSMAPHRAEQSPEYRRFMKCIWISAVRWLPVSGLILSDFHILYLLNCSCSIRYIGWTWTFTGLVRE